MRLSDITRTAWATLSILLPSVTASAHLDYEITVDDSTVFTRPFTTMR